MSAESSAADLARRPQEWTARLQGIGGRLLLAAQGDADRAVAEPIRACADELRAVWRGLRELTLDFDPARVDGLQQRQRELGVLVEVLGGTASTLSECGRAAAARMCEHGGELDALDARSGADRVGLLAELCSRVRHDAEAAREGVASTRHDLGRSGQVVEHVDRMLAAAHVRDRRDALTRVHSRYAFDQRLDELAAQPFLLADYWCVALAEIDNIEAVNRRLGTRVGDALLFRVAGVLQQACDFHPGALVARTGGKEFGIILPRCPLHLARRIAERVREAVGRSRWECKVSPPGGILATTVSLGVVEYRDGEGLADCLDRLDRSLDRARRAGGNTIAGDG